MAVDPATFKAVMGQWPSGVTVVTTVDAEGPAGMTASSFSSVSLNPPLISICIARHLGMHARLTKAGVFAVNILSKDKVTLGLRFAGMLPEVTDRFEGVAASTAITGSPVLANTLGWVDCKVWAAYPGGDHTIFVGEVLDASIDQAATPLLYHSRSWGQFADVLAKEATLTHAGSEENAVVVNNAFGPVGNAAHDVETIVSRVREAIRSRDVPALLVLDDAAGAADPLLVRLTIQAITGLVGRTAIAIRPAAGHMALANILVGLKSGIHHISVSAEMNGPYVAEQDVGSMLDRMGISIRRPMLTSTAK